LWHFEQRYSYLQVDRLKIKGDILVEDIVFEGDSQPILNQAKENFDLACQLTLNTAVPNHSDQVLNPAIENFEHTLNHVLNQAEENLEHGQLTLNPAVPNIDRNELRNVLDSN
jgi:hypothetical protein